MIVQMKSLRGHDQVPAHVNPIHWNQSVGYARQVCARFFRDGGKPADALIAFGLKPAAATDWSKAVELIADTLTTVSARKAA